MIPISYIQHWRQYAPWVYQSQIEQDLVLSRALISLYQQPIIQRSLAFRGGTALNKLFCHSSARYSEDIDLVQVQDTSIGDVMSAIRAALDPWLGKARWKQNERSVKFVYRFTSEDEPSVPLRLKIEINTVEPFTVFGFKSKPYEVNSRWFEGKASIQTYELDELMATKLRALYQRSKGRDLYDLWLAITKLGADVDRVVSAFHHYNSFHNISISRAEYERNLIFKMQDVDFLSDAKQVLSRNAKWDAKFASELVFKKLLSKLKGNSWKGVVKEASPLMVD